VLSTARRRRRQPTAVATIVPRQSDHAANVAAGGRLLVQRSHPSAPAAVPANPIAPPTSRPGGDFARREVRPGGHTSFCRPYYFALPQNITASKHNAAMIAGTKNVRPALHSRPSSESNHKAPCMSISMSDCEASCLPHRGQVAAHHDTVCPQSRHSRRFAAIWFLLTPERTAQQIRIYGPNARTMIAARISQ
jgi:hypothetical protein